MNRQIVEEASAWFVDFRVGDIDSGARERFDAWLRRSPEHIQAYLEIATAYAELPALNTAGAIDVDALIAHARATPDSNVVPLTPRVRPDETPRSAPRARRSSRHLALAAAILVAAVGIAGWWRLQRGVYSTQIGEQRSITLPEGSTIALNARSRIKVTLSGTERHVALLEGQALFQVAHDPRPFLVQSHDTMVRAVGTQFDVERKRTGVVVTVVEGRVVVAGNAREVPSSSASALLPAREGEVLLAAGEQLSVADRVPRRVAHPNVTAATAWTQRRFVFDNASLLEVADEFNRYSTRPLIVDDPRLAEFHISGTYSSTNPESLLRFLRAQPGLQVTETPDAIHIHFPPPDAL